MHVPYGDRNKVFAASLIAEDGDANRLSWLEEAKEDAADIPSLFVGCPSDSMNDQMCHRNVWSIRIIFLQFLTLKIVKLNKDHKDNDLLELDDVLFDSVTLHFLDQVCLWISRVYTIKNVVRYFQF